MEELLKTTIEASVAMGAINKADLQRVIVDSTVQEKAIAHPTDSRLLDVAWCKIVRLAQGAGIKLKLSHEREAPPPFAAAAVIMLMPDSSSG